MKNLELEDEEDDKDKHGSSHGKESENPNFQQATQWRDVSNPSE
jgi:hypothetical protein